MKLMIQIPCYNEAETLGLAIHDLPTHIDGIDTIAVSYTHLTLPTNSLV